MAKIIEKIVVIGAGQAGFSACSKLRSLGFEGSIDLIGDESHPPYQRPPISKSYLLGEMDLKRMFLRPETFYEEKSIFLKKNTKVQKIIRDNKTLILSNGEKCTYDKLILCTGSHPIRLTDSLGGNLSSLYYVRSIEDADMMTVEFQKGKKILIIGGGYIGLEVAAVASKMEVNTTLVEASDRILQRVASKETSDYFRKLHTLNGVNIIEGVKLRNLEGKNGKVIGANLSDGSQVGIDFVVAGIGIRPNQILAEEADLEIENGIKVNEFCQTSDPNIFAAGDCASFPFNNERIRLESVGNAIDQAEHVAKFILGDTEPYRAKPWFWSDQYDIKLQIAGLSTAYDDIITRRIDERSVSFWYYSNNKLIAVDAMNDPRVYMVAKRLIEMGKTPDQNLISDPEVNIKMFLNN